MNNIVTLGTFLGSRNLTDPIDSEILTKVLEADLGLGDPQLKGLWAHLRNRFMKDQMEDPNSRYNSLFLLEQSIKELILDSWSEFGKTSEIEQTRISFQIALLIAKSYENYLSLTSHMISYVDEEFSVNIHVNGIIVDDEGEVSLSLREQKKLINGLRLQLTATNSKSPTKSMSTIETNELAARNTDFNELQIKLEVESSLNAELITWIKLRLQLAATKLITPLLKSCPQ